MRVLLDIMIYVGSILMVFNIIRYFLFARRINRMERVKKSRLMMFIPFILLCFFLVGYVLVAALGSPDIIMAGILFGGSVFVFILLAIIYNIVDRIVESETFIENQYEEMREEINTLTDNSLAVFRVNLTRNEIEMREGNDLYDEDLTATTYTELLEARKAYLICRMDDREKPFNRENLISYYREGHSRVSEIILTRRKRNVSTFVLFTATLTEQPSTGDVIAFINESDYNDEMVNRVVLDRALSYQYDMIAYIVDGKYRVVMDSDEHGEGSAAPDEPTGDYSVYVDGFIAPHISLPDGEKAELLNSLKTDAVRENLKNASFYEVNVKFNSDKKDYYKQFEFFEVNSQTGFYILLVNDTTEVHKQKDEQNRILSAALEEAKRANNAKTVFLSNLSHDLRTPMNAVIGFTELAGKSADPAEIKTYLEKIDFSGKYLLAIINDVLEMSRIDSGKVELVPVETDLTEVFFGLRDLFSAQMAEKGVKFTVDCSEIKNRRVSCDKTRVNRILLNLLSNALKFTPAGGAVEVRAAQTDTTGTDAEYRITVKDTGIGMTPEFVAKVFDAFERERNAVVSDIQGTGLGMTITKNLITMMGGTIEVESKKNEGSTFAVVLRFPTLQETENQADKTAEDGEAPVDCSGYRLLIVDDTEINREIAKLMLSELGFMLEEADDGKKAVEMISSAKPGYYDLVLMDVQMPDMNGYDATRAIRKMDGGRENIPVIAVTANVFSEEEGEERGAGMNGHISKPFNSEELISGVLKLLKKKEK